MQEKGPPPESEIKHQDQNLIICHHKKSKNLTHKKATKSPFFEAILKRDIECLYDCVSISDLVKSVKKIITNIIPNMKIVFTNLCINGFITNFPGFNLEREHIREDIIWKQNI